MAEPSLDPVLDEELEERTPEQDGDVVKDSYKASVVFLLMSMSYAYMELRHYTEAQECIKECIEYAENKVPDLYIRRAQTILYNKYSDLEDYKLALQDAQKAIELKEVKKEKDPIYFEILENIRTAIKQKENEDFEKVLSKLKMLIIDKRLVQKG